MPADTRTCPICWNPFTPSDRNSNRHTYCSGRCRAEAGRRRAREDTTAISTPAATPKPYQPEPAALRDCPHCGQPVTIVALLTTPQVAQQTPIAPNVVTLRAARNN